MSTLTETAPVRSSPLTHPTRTYTAEPEIKEHQPLAGDFQQGKVLASIATGALFGFIAHKSDVFRASVIRDQFNFTDWTLMKVFTTAILTSMLVMTGMNHFPKTRTTIASVAETYNYAQIGLISSAVGGFLVGIGAALCGAFPSVSWVQLGAGSPSTLATIAGGIFGALFFGMQHERIISKINRFALLPSKSIGDYVGLTPLVSTFALAGSLVAGIAFMEATSPSVYPTFLKSVFGISASSWLPTFPRFNFLTAARWNPIISGILIGLLQIPAVMILGKNLTTSSAYVTLASTFTSQNVHAPNSYFGQFRSGLNNWWRVLFVFGAVAGSFLAYATSNTDLLYDISRDGVPLYKAFLGGATMVFGARMVGGPGGIGLSDLGKSTFQFVAAEAAMLGGGYLMRQMMYVPFTFAPGKPVFNNKDL